MQAMIATKPPVTEDILFVDGISRSGKKLACKVVSHLERVEYFQYVSLIENIVYWQSFGRLQTPDVARFIRFYVDEVIYNRAIGRNLNTRPSDETSISRGPEPEAYLRRAAGPDGTAAMDRFNAEGRIPLFHTHSVLAFADVLFEAYPRLKLIHVTRHPIDIAEDWYRRGWGERWGVDPLAFNVTAETGAGVVPWYAVAWAEEYLEMTPAERCIEAVVRLQRDDREKLDSFDPSRRRQVHQFNFESLIAEPAAVVRGLVDFVGSKSHRAMDALLVSENCPAALPVEERRARLDKLQAESSREVVKRLVAAARRYERQWRLESVS